jgi:[ribosomal protein S5]-alanine N-acetyltransferase
MSADTARSWTPGALVELHTPRLVLRTMLREDVTDDLVAWLSDPAVQVGMNMPARLLSRAQGVRWALDHDNRTRFCLAIQPHGEARAVGLFTIQCDPVHRVAETTVVIGERRWWGQGLVIEGRGALLPFIFETLDMHKLIGRPHSRNFASIFNYQAMGFRNEAVLREQMLAVNGKGRLDQLVFGLLRSEWLARRDARPA